MEILSHASAKKEDKKAWGSNFALLCSFSNDTMAVKGLMEEGKAWGK